jgi:tetratricopeptide (TPR) repeat protein
MANNPTNFWQELKRRRVIRVIIGYLASAYVLLELASIVVEPLGLPEWTIKLILVLLVVGFVIAISLSWIYDFTSKGLVKTESAVVAEKTASEKKPGKRRPKVSDLIIAVLVIVVIILAWPRIFKPDKLERLRSEDEITIVVMPFQNMTGDEKKDFWQEMVQDNLITSLSNTEALNIRQPESINILLQNTDIDNYASITPAIAKNVSKKLEAGVYISGSINSSGETIRINAKLVDSETEEIFKSFRIEGVSDSIVYLCDSLSVTVKDYLVITILQNEVSPDIHSFYGSTKSPEALRYLLDGRNAYFKRDDPAAREMLHRAIEIDSNYFSAIRMLIFAYSNDGLYEDAKKWCLKVYKQRNRMSRIEELIIEYQHAYLFETPNEEIKYLKQILEIDNQQAIYYYNLGMNYIKIIQFEKAIPEFHEALQLYKKWGIKPPWIWDHAGLGFAYFKTGQYKKLKKVCRAVKKDFPNDPMLFRMQASLTLAQNRTRQANEYIAKYISALKEMSNSEATIAASLGWIYNEVQSLDKAEEYYREALSLEPGNTDRMIDLARILIDHDLDIEEGMELAEKALESDPENYNNLDAKGWGLYKQGNYREALYILQKSWDLRMENAIYSHAAFLHLEAVEQALTNQLQ